MQTFPLFHQVKLGLWRRDLRKNYQNTVSMLQKNEIILWFHSEKNMLPLLKVFTKDFRIFMQRHEIFNESYRHESEKMWKNRLNLPAFQSIFVHYQGTIIKDVFREDTTQTSFKTLKSFWLLDVYVCFGVILFSKLRLNHWKVCKQQTHFYSTTFRAAKYENFFYKMVMVRSS